jgi:hypothetical protein
VLRFVLLREPHLIDQSQSGKRNARRWIAVCCILLALLISGLEATHAHTGATAARDASSCAICISAHANAPAIVFGSLPVLYAVEIISIPLRSQTTVAAPEHGFFIRPPPAVL